MLLANYDAPALPFVLTGIVAVAILVGWPYLVVGLTYCRRCWHAARRMKRHGRL